MDVLEGLNVLVTISGKVNCWTLYFSLHVAWYGRKIFLAACVLRGKSWLKSVGFPSFHLWVYSLFLQVNRFPHNTHACLLPVPPSVGWPLKMLHEFVGNVSFCSLVQYFESWKLMFCEVWENGILSLCHDCFQPGLFLTKTQCATWFSRHFSCVLKSVEWGKLLQKREVRVMCYKSVWERSTVCTWCGNNQSESGDGFLVSHWGQLGNGKPMGEEEWWWWLCLFCVC